MLFLFGVFQVTTVSLISTIVRVRHVNMAVPVKIFCLTMTAVVRQAGKGKTAMLILTSVTVDSARITRTARTWMERTRVHVLPASQAPTVLLISMNANRILVLMATVQT